MADIDTVASWRGRTVLDETGDKIGKFEEIYLDADSDRPEWASVTTGLFGLRQTLIPLRGAQEQGDDLRVPFAKDHVKDAPNVDPDEQLSHEEETVLYRHYGIESGASEAPAGASQPDADESSQAASPVATDTETGDRPSEAAPAAPPEAEASPGAPPHGQPETDPAPGTGREEPAEQDESASEPSPAREQEIPLDTEVGPRERVRLRKYVVTDEVTKTVPVEREEVRVEREPFDSSQPRSAEGDEPEQSGPQPD